MNNEANINTATLFPVTSKDVTLIASSVALQGKLTLEDNDDVAILVEFVDDKAYVDVLEGGKQTEAGLLTLDRTSSAGNLVFTGTFRGEQAHLTYFATRDEIAEGDVIESHGRYMRGILGLGEAQSSAPRMTARRQG